MRKGTFRITVLTLWLLLWIKLGCITLAALAPISGLELNILASLVVFAGGFYTIPMLTIKLLELSESLDPSSADVQFMDLKDPITRMVFVTSIIASTVVLGIYAYIRPSPARVGICAIVFVLPFIVILGSYVLLLWIVKGYRG